MQNKQRGIGGLHLLVVIAAIAAVTYIAVPKYQDYVIRSKISEALTVASDSKTKLTEFYMTNGRFPNSDTEAETVQTTMFSKPQFVRDVVVNHEAQEHEIVIQVYFKEGAIPSSAGQEHYFYMAGDTLTTGNSSVEWTCGGKNIEEKLLPSRC